VRAFGPGERIIFEPYTRAMFERAVGWMSSWNLGAEIGAAGEYGRAAFKTE
jgi:NitT/TauT family transport system substrate-binding protein